MGAVVASCYYWIQTELLSVGVSDTTVNEASAHSPVFEPKGNDIK